MIALYGQEQPGLSRWIPAPEYITKCKATSAGDGDLFKTEYLPEKPYSEFGKPGVLKAVC